MRISDMQGRLRLLGDSIVIDTLHGIARDGPLVLDGGIGLAKLSEPSFDLRLTAEDARVLDNEQGRANADIEASMYGPFQRTYVNGRVRVRSGVIYLPENDDRQMISNDDAALFAVADTSVATTRELLPATSPFMENLRLSLGLRVDRDTWVRSREANVEIFSEDWLRIAMAPGRSTFTLDGVVSTERGEYTFMSRRFQIRRGSATFIGAPDVNPTVQATAEYEVRVPGREAMFIRLLIGGTVRSPRLTLESSAQPPITQSDLLAYLAFGRSSSSLLQLGGSGLGGGGGNLAGTTAALARNQIAAIALGVAVAEVEQNAARSLNVDVLNITPADVQGELLSGNVGGFAASTEIEAGRYWGQSRWFGTVTGRPFSLLTPNIAAAPPGLTLQYRTPRGWRFEGSLQPRYLLTTPTLERQPATATSVLGLFLIKEWRF
jgi:translocation and assembly module TamB